MDRAVVGNRIPRSPCRDIDLPKLESVEMRFLSAAEINALAEAIDPRYRSLALTAGYTGLRFGELAALRPARVDLLRRRISVEETLNEVSGHLHLGPPKTKASRRAVSIPAFLADVLAANMKGELVFTSPEDGALRRGLFNRRFYAPAVKRSVGAPCRFHDLRHSHAAMLIAQGVHPRLLMERLGHSSIRTTLDLYGHLLPGLDEAAADALDAVYGGASAGYPRDEAQVLPITG
jgi:integrase